VENQNRFIQIQRIRDLRLGEEADAKSLRSTDTDAAPEHLTWVLPRGSLC
jgi:hypothetical protein